jgi:protein-S-isoprenylcysteine O-methyltransferase Ste14
MAESVKQQLYFVDMIAFLLAAAAIAFYVPPGPRFYLGMALAAAAFVLWILARVQLGASFSATAQAKKLVTGGLYAWFRNPIYLFGMLAYLGLAIAWGTLPGIVMVALMFPFQMLRARKEQAVLENAFGDEYRRYKARTLF